MEKFLIKVFSLLDLLAATLPIMERNSLAAFSLVDFFLWISLVDLHFATLPIMERNPLATFLSVRAPSLIPTFTRLEDSLPRIPNMKKNDTNKKPTNIPSLIPTFTCLEDSQPKPVEKIQLMI